jgi:S1-C subfamily serine protease
VHRWLLVVICALTSCSGSTATVPVEPAAAALNAMLDVRAGGCGPRVGFGSATLIDDTLALTAAHVVAGAKPVSVIDVDGDVHDARVVWFDPDLDLAALRVPAGIGTPVALDTGDVDDIEDGVVAISRGAFDNRLVTTADVVILRHVNVATTDIYLDREVVRPGFEVTGAIEPGDSGTMVVTNDGAAGVVWSRSNATADRAWVVDVPDDFRRADFRSSLDADVGLGPCLR